MEHISWSTNLTAYIVVSLGGAMIHWWQKVRRGEATANFLDYWVTETPGYSLGTAGALVAGWFALWASNSLAGVNLPLLLSSAFTFGFAVDSIVAPKAG
jgi:hypothetical protein